MVPCPNPPSQAPCPPELELVSEISGPSVTALTSELPSELLRGIDLVTCLKGWGRYWWNRNRKEMYHLSKPIQCFDAFLSHDWGTPGWMKVWALLLIFNSVPAAFVALGVCVCTCSLLMVGQLPGGWPTATISIYVSFLVILIFWQRIRNSLGCRVPTVFLDCVCIAQHDEELKKAGIQALGGFLTQSQELLILWSPRTFERLWCNFELACFLRQNVASSGKFQKRIRLVPLSMARLLGLAGLTNLWLWLAWLVWVIIESNAFLPGLAVLLASVAVLGPSLLGQLSLQTYLGMRQMQDFLDLYEQLGNFSVRSASCTCCLMNHQTTEGQRILCDRQQIFATIKRWYWTENADPEHHLDHFDKVVQTQLLSEVKSALGIGIPPLQYVIAMLGVPPLTLIPPYMHMGITQTATYDIAGPWWQMMQWMMMAIHVPAMAFLIFFINMFGWHIGLQLRRKHFVSMPCSLCLVMWLQLFVLGSVWCTFAYFSFPKEPWRLIPATCALWAVVIGLYLYAYRHLAKNQRKT